MTLKTALAGLAAAAALVGLARDASARLASNGADLPGQAPGRQAVRTRTDRVSSNGASLGSRAARTGPAQPFAALAARALVKK